MTAEDDGAAVAKRAAARPAVIATALLATFAAGMGLRYAAETGAALPYAAVLAATAAAAGAALWLNARDLARMRRVEFRLRAAIDALPDGLAVYDAAERIVLWNARYPEHLTPSMRPHLAAGRRFEDILRAGIASGPVYHPDMGPDFPEKRLAMRALDRSDHAQRLADGRWLRIRESRTPDGGRVLLTQDVTQERRRDGELRLLATAIEQVGEPVEITDAAHVFTYVNHAFETLTGWRSEEAIGRQPQDVLASGVHPPEFFADMLARLEGGGTWQGTIVNRHRDGRLIEQDTTISPLRGPDGVISHYVAVKRDVTATRAQARALAESEARYRAVVDAQTELIIRVDPKGRWTFMNPASVRYWGMTAEETNALGISDADTIHPSDRAAFREHLARITPDNPTHAIEVRSVQMNGEVHWEAWTDTGIFDAGGNLLEVQCVGRVIDDRKRAEADRDSAERLRQAALEAALDCYVGIDATGVIVEFNAAAERTFGYARGEVLGQRMADLIIPPHLRAAHLAGFERHLATGEARLLGRRVELEAMRADGATFPIELVIVRADRDGGPLFLAYLRDLTARRAAEDALAASEARFRQIAEGVPVGVIISEIGTGRPLFLNATARRQLGLGQEDPAPETMLATWVDAGDRDRLLAEVARAGAVSGFEAELHAEGGRITAHLSATRIDYGGRPALMTAAIDITEHRRTQAELEASEARLNAIIAANPAPMNIARLSDRRLVFVNEPYVAMYALADVDLDTFDRDVLYADVADRDLIYGEIAAGRDVTNLEIVLKRVDGSEVPASLTSRPILFQGERCLVTTSIDLTALRAAQAEAARSREALHQSEKLTALGSLLAGVSHELNNPLSVVVGYASMLMELDTEPKLAERIAKIHAAADRCARIVRTFLAMARARAPKRGPVALADVALGALDLTGYALRSADVAVDVDVPATLPPVEADADQLHQVVVNLIVNAQQALLGQAGPRRLDIRGFVEGDEAVLEVADNGPGMDPAVAKRAFEPFFTTKPQGVGTGVGLSVVHGIVSAHGGRIDLDTAAGAGARLRVRLPLSQATPDEAAAGAEPAHAAGRILVVDDETEIATLLAERLRLSGLTVATASSGRRALAMLEAGGFDAVVSDLRMPDIDGLALAREIARRWPRLAHRIVIVTGDALGAGVDAATDGLDLPVFEKPLDLAALAAELMRRLGEGAPA